MPVQYGQCLNRAGCSLAYTGEIIRYEGDARCPECGQPLGPAARPRKKLPWIPAAAVLVLLAAAATGFLVWQRRSQPEPLPHPGGSLAAPQTEENRGQVVVEGDTTKLSPSLPPPLAPGASASPTSSGTPPRIANENVAAAAAAPSAADTTPEAAAPAPAGSPSEESVTTKPPTLSAQQIDITRADVLKRIAAMPRMSAKDKDRLAQKVESAHGMERLRVVHFDLGKTALSRPLADALTKSFSSGDVKEKLADPTLVLVVAGYADSGGDADANLRISEERAEAVSKLLKKAGVLNVIHTVAMGSTDLLDGKRPDQNRAVEVWAVAP